LSGDEIEFGIYGSGDIDCIVNSNRVTASIHGSGDINLKGNTMDFEANINGSGDINGQRFKVNSADVSINGSGNCKLTVVDALKARIFGSGNLYYEGTPRSIDQQITGSGEVKKI
jgi:hypothetical protein